MHNEYVHNLCTPDIIRMRYVGHVSHVDELRSEPSHSEILNWGGGGTWKTLAEIGVYENGS